MSIFIKLCTIFLGWMFAVWTMVCFSSFVCCFRYSFSQRASRLMSFSGQVGVGRFRMGSKVFILYDKPC